MLMTDNPDDFIAIQLHHDDDWATSWTENRWRFYGSPGLPDTWFDGLVQRHGAYLDDMQMYNWYLGAINARRAVPTDVTIDLKVVRTAEQTFNVVATVGIESGGVGKTMKYHVVQVLDWYPPPNPDRRHRNCVVQHQALNDFPLAAGESTDIAKSFTLSGDSWADKGNVKFVAWVRQTGSSAPKEIYQAAHIAWPFYRDGDVDRDGDIDLSDLAALLAAYDTCEGEAGYNQYADFNYDQCIDLSDLASLLANYGT